MKNILLCLFIIGTFCVSDAADKDAMQVDDNGPFYVSYKKIYLARVLRKQIDAQLGAEILDIQVLRTDSQDQCVDSQDQHIDPELLEEIKELEVLRRKQTREDLELSERIKELEVLRRYTRAEHERFDRQPRRNPLARRNLLGSFSEGGSKTTLMTIKR